MTLEERMLVERRAGARSEAWLKSCLSPEQLADYKHTLSFVVVGGDTGHRYRIHFGGISNILRLGDNGQAGMWLCFGPRGVPVGDIMLHQKLALEGDEQAALRIARRGALVPIGPSYLESIQRATASPF